MARMIPDYIHRDCKSSAERALFKRLRQELPDSYTVFHSLGLARHAGKLKAEIDFVIACRRGLLCLEVKGGRIKRERGVWYFINRFDEVTIKRESPFDQSSSAMYSLRSSLVKQFGVESPQCKAVSGYGVIFPNQSFTLESPEWDLNRLIDEKKIGDNLQNQVERLFDYSSQEIHRVSGRECPEMSRAHFDRLINYLRPDFDLVPTLSSRITDYHDTLLKLTEEQYDILDQLGANDRIVILGSAGTGKTLLAVEKARREAQYGRRVIYICFNRLLALHIRQVLKAEMDSGLIEVNTLHGYARKVISMAGLDEALGSADQETLFAEQYPDLFAQAFVELYKQPPFDVLIVDEGQDLKTIAYLSMIDWLLEDGMQAGRWVWFEDSQQNIFNAGADCAGEDLLERYRHAICHLTKNCRNTKPISVFNSMATATERQRCLVDSDLKVSPVFYKSRKHQIELLKNIITRLLGGGVNPIDIVLLSPLSRSRSVLGALDSIGGIVLLPYGETVKNSRKTLQYTTIQKFKGLESKVVVVTDISELESDEMRALNYVAFSRPNSCLEILISECVRDQYARMAYRFGLGN